MLNSFRIPEWRKWPKLFHWAGQLAPVRNWRPAAKVWRRTCCCPSSLLFTTRCRGRTTRGASTTTTAGISRRRRLAFTRRPIRISSRLWLLLISAAGRRKRSRPRLLCRLLPPYWPTWTSKTLPGHPITCTATWHPSTHFRPFRRAFHAAAIRYWPWRRPVTQRQPPRKMPTTRISTCRRNPINRRPWPSRPGSTYRTAGVAVCAIPATLPTVRSAGWSPHSSNNNNSQRGD